jgi:hypothetical protein
MGNSQKNQSYFTIGGLRPISSSWPQAPRDSDLQYFFLRDILSDERMGLSFTIAAELRQRSHSHVRVPRDSWSHFAVSD